MNSPIAHATVIGGRQIKVGILGVEIPEELTSALNSATDRLVFEMTKFGHPRPMTALSLAVILGSDGCNAYMEAVRLAISAVLQSAKQPK